jgi:membrane-associated PAP2 superfamily phosphatase
MDGGFPADFVSGAITLGYVVLGLFFLRFWRRTRDALFANFTVAFWLLALNQGAATLSNHSENETSWIYLLRLAAFLVIIAAIVRKNVAAPQP